MRQSPHNTQTLAQYRIPEADILRGLFHAAYDHALPVVLWRRPHAEHKQAIIDLSGHARAVNADLDELGSGFLFSPFNTQHEATDSLFISADLHLSTADMELHISPTLPNEAQSPQQEALARLWEVLPRYMQPHTHTPYYTNPKAPQEQSTADHYINLVAQSVEAIEQGTFQKVVPSRNKFVSLPDDFDLIENFETLCNTYPNAFVNLVAIPGIGTWVGATPEVLIEVDKAGTFHTVALAGTQVLPEGQTVDDVAWKHKEIMEQALVGRYIINCFKKIRLREFDEQGPRTAKAGKLVHLKSDYFVDTQDTNFPELGTVMLRLLHPTSAVCGMPKEPATAFLYQHEGYDREFYAGFLGPINMHQETHLYVNLRCMQLLKDKAVLYAGAGVTADSNPEKEWIETEHKCNTMLSVLQRNKGK